MTRGGLLWVGVLAAIMAGAVPAASALAATPLVLKVGGVAAPDGSRASGALSLPCAQLAFGGTLTINDAATDKAVFDEGGGSDTCEGVRVRGQVKAIKLTSGGRFLVITHLSYEVLTSGTCVYAVSKLAGDFTIPGMTSASVSGTGNLAVKRSTAGCREQIAISEAAAALYHGETREPYFAEI